MIKQYNKKPEKGFNAKTVEKKFHSALERDVPHTKIPCFDPKFDNDKCWWCQEFPRLKAEPDVLIWCERCYVKHFEKIDGTFISHTSIPALKQLTKDISEHKYVETSLKTHDTRYVEE